MKKFRLGILGSGRGSNMAAIADAISAQAWPMEVGLVLSDVSTAGILDHARNRHLPANFLPPGKFRTKLDEEAERAYIQALLEAEVDLVVLAGFMRILKGAFLEIFAQKVVNIHPSLLPAFPGLEAWRQALEYGVKVTGVTIHWVDQGIDTGAIIAQEPVIIEDNDSAEILHERIQRVERRLYPATILEIAMGRVGVQGRRTFRTKPEPKFNHG